MNTVKADLHNLVDIMPEHSAVIVKKFMEFILKEQEAFEDEIIFEPLNASELTDDDRVAIDQAKEEIARGETISAEKLFKDLGI